VADDPRCSPANPMWAEVEHPGVGVYRMPGSPLTFSGVERVDVRRAPLLGEHTEEVLAKWLGMSTDQIRELRKCGAVGSISPKEEVAARSAAAGE
jgi:2-methylfumaryl-CoA isomerase